MPFTSKDRVNEESGSERPGERLLLRYYARLSDRRVITC